MKNQLCIANLYKKCNKNDKCNYAHSINDYIPQECDCIIEDCPLNHQSRKSLLNPFTSAKINILYQNRKRCSNIICQYVLDGEKCLIEYCPHAHTPHELNYEICRNDYCECIKLHHFETSESYFNRIIKLNTQKYSEIMIKIDSKLTNDFTKKLNDMGIYI